MLIIVRIEQPPDEHPERSACDDHHDHDANGEALGVHQNGSSASARDCGGKRLACFTGAIGSCATSCSMTITQPVDSSASGSSPGKTLATREYSTMRASSAITPAATNASSVERTSFETSGFLSAHVRRFFGAEAGFGIVNTMRHTSGPSSVAAPLRAARAASETSRRHGATFLLDSTMIARPVLFAWPTNFLLPWGAGVP